ncbi:MAG: (4Fe-4S)-binding protein [Candidatus Thiodiazotropha endolucinida]|nr:(4Fe-4S)-binding protein [Candidatus Thiodiazotropha taylori]MCG8026258.1 (4Fe-4S)-binding protein [Candidatus Thiodiazotropha endolucinida]MCG7882411.1 (4Fe-4S)-binding protein [Candidatus Thiodiazotropha taylori]MCG7887032.1 (4Fe-4S)-binding protein [Candidatus Thiodiazotropha taylori]MCG7889168.1 (4Fe-4S)-binding protein [Candidatus Thiodiazotropha taylori]
MNNISWDEKTCQHAGNCVKGLPTVFRIENDQFVIDENAASYEEIKKVVDSCPSGALKLQD